MVINGAMERVGVVEGQSGMWGRRDGDCTENELGAWKNWKEVEILVEILAMAVKHG